MKHKLFEVTYKAKWKGETLMKFKVKKGKASTGIFRKYDSIYKETEICPLTFAEPTKELFLSMFKLTDPNMEIIEIEWKSIGEYDD